MIRWKMTMSMARFNYKYVAYFNNKSDAKHVVMKAKKEGIWIKDIKGPGESFWSADAIAKVHIGLESEEDVNGN